MSKPGRIGSSFAEFLQEQGDREAVEAAARPQPEDGFWNYRLVQRRNGSVSLHEVHYHPDGRPRAMTADPIAFSVSTEAEQADLLASMHRALKDAHDRPLLVEADAFPVG